MSEYVTYGTTAGSSYGITISPQEAESRPRPPAGLIVTQAVLTAPAETPPIPTRPGVRRGQPLTDRERQVLDLASHGLTDNAIAKRLHLSLNTVKTHMKFLLVRLDARNRTHAVRLGFHRGYLTADRSTES